MPELPEVETTLRGLYPHIMQQKIVQVIIRCHSLRWPVPKNLKQNLLGRKVSNLERRGKYLLLQVDQGTVIIHLGMSGRIQLLSLNIPAQKHDHIDIAFSNHKILRFTDPRRFGFFLWTEHSPLLHPLLKDLGPEPLTQSFTGNYLYQKTQKSKVAIKVLIMNSKVVVGVGNIYANEALFMAGIHPQAPANTLSLKQCRQLAVAIKKVLRQAIKSGGTTLKDFLDSEGRAGYFATALQVYGRDKLPCMRCQTLVQSMRLAQRSTFFCPTCQLLGCYPEQITKRVGKY